MTEKTANVSMDKSERGSGSAKVASSATTRRIANAGVALAAAVTLLRASEAKANSITVNLTTENIGITAGTLISPQESSASQSLSFDPSLGTLDGAVFNIQVYASVGYNATDTGLSAFSGSAESLLAPALTLNGPSYSMSGAIGGTTSTFNFDATPGSQQGSAQLGIWAYQMIISDPTFLNDLSTGGLSLTELLSSQVNGPVVTLDGGTGNVTENLNEEICGTVQLNYTPNRVPDGGSTMAMLGLALTGMEVLRRKKLRS